MTSPIIPEIYARHRAAAVIHTPFGVMLEGDMACLIKATARDCGLTVKETRDALLQHWIDEARARTAAMTPAERRAMTKAQALTFARAEVGFGTDAAEAEYREAVRTGDTKTQARLDAEATARLARFDAAMGALTNA